MLPFPDDRTGWRRPITPSRSVVAAPAAADPRVPDLQSQLEGLLDAVWLAEENWRFDDRLDQAIRLLRD